ncbi:(2')5'-bisphosphate nucleotidase 1 [Holotrichia oblita]|uniref:(2')5'-bisphosphate nucleotidase 1 n=1 Tax=Holotrichia oblita TaxID=644536 RepID=A0ACB9STA8_HOLOL|nr:(2')5'-bisphosphate nucleotidase 1 [Holotrichia oblita]
MSLLESLIVVSEKAANIARICRQDRHLFQLLVQEKSQSEANPRFVQDFKTLADVLIQETIKRDIIRKCIWGDIIGIGHLSGIRNRQCLANYICLANIKWRGKCYWGANYANSLRSSPQSPTGVICISGSEDELVKRKLIDCGGYRLVEAAGAGYKMLAVIEGLADAYILTKNSTFKWDSCGPQAILKCFGGGLIVYEAAVRGNLIEVDYNNGERSDGEDNGDNEGEEKNTSKIEKFCNRGGIIAYNNVNVLNDILKALRK